MNPVAQAAGFFVSGAVNVARAPAWTASERLSGYNDRLISSYRCEPCPS